MSVISQVQCIQSSGRHWSTQLFVICCIHVKLLVLKSLVYREQSVVMATEVFALYTFSPQSCETVYL